MFIQQKELFAVVRKVLQDGFVNKSKMCFAQQRRLPELTGRISTFQPEQLEVQGTLEKDDSACELSVFEIDSTLQYVQIRRVMPKPCFRKHGCEDQNDSSAMGSDDIIAGNVSKIIVLPPAYSGQPKKGHLIFDACFESGNLGRVDHVTEFEYDLFIRPDTCNPRFRVWFNFTVENVKESQLLNSWPVSAPLDRNSCKFREKRLPDGQESH
ncbi:hypothetical protein BTVI_105812 [Pitangus sulphuratus]|nr:hypothetical protein BTVI_105812 [Pitangus sulphuratus]